MRLAITQANQLAGGGSYVVDYEAEIILLDEPTVLVELHNVIPGNSDPVSIEEARMAIQLGVEQVLRPLHRGASVRVERIVIHPSDFKPSRIKAFTSSELERLLGKAAA